MAKGQWCDTCKGRKNCRGPASFLSDPPCLKYSKIGGSLKKTGVKKDRGLCLERALEIINGGVEKVGQDGKPEDSFQTLADLWDAYCKGRGMKTFFTKSDTSMMLALLKVARHCGQTYNPDNCTDLAGYAGLSDDFKRTEAENITNE